MADEEEDSPTTSSSRQSPMGFVLTRGPTRGSPEARWLQHVQGIYKGLMQTPEVQQRLTGSHVALGSGNPLPVYQDHIRHPGDAFPVSSGFCPQSLHPLNITPKLSDGYSALDEPSWRCNYEASSSILHLSPSYELHYMPNMHSKLQNLLNEQLTSQTVEPTHSHHLDCDAKQYLSELHSFHQLHHPLIVRDKVGAELFSQEADSKILNEAQSRTNNSPPVEKNITNIHATSSEIETEVNDVASFDTSIKSKRKSNPVTSFRGLMDLTDVCRKAEMSSSFEVSTCTPSVFQESTVLVPNVSLDHLDLDQESFVRSDSSNSNKVEPFEAPSPVLDDEKLCRELLATDGREKKRAFTTVHNNVIQESVQLTLSEERYSTETNTDESIGPTSASGSTKTSQTRELSLQPQWQETDETMSFVSKADSQGSGVDGGAHSEDDVIQFCEDSSEYSSSELENRTLSQGSTTETNTMEKMKYQDQPPPDNKCPICQDKVSGYHYGMYSCESCKGFFKRTIHSQRHENLHCLVGGGCIVTLQNRKQCAACRFQKCLSLGMKLEAIRQDRQRGGRSLYEGSSEQRRLSRLKEQEVKVKVPKKCKRRWKSTKADSTDSVTCRPKTLLAFPLNWEPIKNNIPNTEYTLQSKLAGLPQLIKDLATQEECYAQQSLPQCCLNTLQVEKNLLETICHFVNHQMVPIVIWAKGLPLYSQLVIEDQGQLLQNSILNLLCLNLIFYCLDRACRLLLPQGCIIDLTTFNSSKFHKLVPKITSISQQLHSAGFDLASFVCLKLIVLLRPDTANLEDASKVQMYQDLVQDMLLDHVTTNRPQDSHTIGNLMLGLAAIERIVQQVSQETGCNKEVVNQLLHHSGPSAGLKMPWIWTKPL